MVAFLAKAEVALCLHPFSGHYSIGLALSLRLASTSQAVLYNEQGLGAVLRPSARLPAFQLSEASLCPGLLLIITAPTLKDWQESNEIIHAKGYSF